MPTRLYGLVQDALHPLTLVRFWEEALSWSLGEPDGGFLPLQAPWAPDQLPWGVLFQRVSETKAAQARLHLDLASTSTAQQQRTVDRLRSLGAVPADVGQRDVPWVVLADPEGNEFCVLEPRDTYRDTGTLAAVVVAAADPHALSDFWGVASGWEIDYQQDDVVGLRSPAGSGPMLEFVRSTERKVTKNRLHLDVAPGADDDQSEEVARLINLGAERADIGQGDVAWVVLTDPEGNEFCVLSPR